MRLDLLLRISTKIFLPFIAIFAFYVQFHGDYGPGGGFQAGVIFSAAIILFTLIFGEKRAKSDFPEKIFHIMIPLGVLIFMSTGIYSLFMGYNFLDYDALSHHPKHGQHLGILLIEIGVFITVIGSMVSIFYSFISGGKK
tara:strand:+ start:206 stop:625 length:420 start_codon:yes stop_codon:yes gene_type:complete